MLVLVMALATNLHPSKSTASLFAPVLLMAFASYASAQVVSVRPADARASTQAGHVQAAQAAGASTSPTEATVPELVTDRPDFTESSDVVGHGVVQIETGLTLESDRSGTVLARSITTPSMLVRIGMGRHFELRLGGDGFLRGWTDVPSAPAVSGYSDVEVGVKIKFLDLERFDMSVIPIVSIPTRNEHYSSGTYDTTVKLTWATELPHDFGLSGNVNVASLSDDLGRFAQEAVSVSLGHDLGAGWGGYWEGYVFTPMVRGAGAGWTLNTGVTRGIGNNMQFDVEVGRGVSAAAPDWFVGVGFAVRGWFGPRR